MKIPARFKAASLKFKRRFGKQTKHLYSSRLLPLIQKVVYIVNSSLFARFYAVSAVVFLLATTVFWSILGARLHEQNADQLVNALLFEKPATFRDALLPGSHSFLLKWPLFYLIKLFGFTANAYVGVTVLVVLFTVSLLIIMLYRIDRRLIVFGTIMLALSSVLMLIPPVAYAGALLPVNMSMLATRNIEYIVFIISIFLLIRTKHIRSWSFLAGTFLLALLIASDKLFLSLTIGGSVIALLVYGLTSGWNLVSTSARWLLGGVLSVLGSAAVVEGLGSAKITHLVSQTGVGPYGLAGSIHDVLLASVFAGLHLLTNFGANPASQTTILGNIPHNAVQNLVSFAAIGYLLNMALFIFALFAAAQIIRHSLAHNKDRQLWLSRPAKLSSMLVWVSIAAILVFVVSEHYYAADARYLGIILFTLCLSATTYLSRITISSKLLTFVGLVLLIGTLLSIPHVLSNYHSSETALAPYANRNERIVAALSQHPEQVVVGDYWRVVPIKHLRTSQNIVPLADCTTPRDTLSSHAWEHDLSKTHFAYLYSLDSGLTDFPHCTLDTIVAAYGRPNASVVIDGSITHPKEMLLFFDNGARKSAPITKQSSVSTVQPIELDELPSTSCRQQTIMNIVAHEDDDILFMNPDTNRDLQAENCVRTVYITSGDAGQNAFYWLGRERASQAAYAHMLNHTDIWVERVVHLQDDAYATIANPRGNTKVSLVYLHLPDGNMRGQGFASHHHESLDSLVAGRISAVHDVYSGAPYSAANIQSIITDLMQTFQPTEIRTQAHVAGGVYPDHSDHLAVGTIAQKAYQQYEAEHFGGRVVIPIKYYIGYPIHNLPVNLSSNEQDMKQEVFSTYSKYDGSVCHTVMQCRQDPAYGIYLTRQYQNPY